jgi:hypothetical protein
MRARRAAAVSLANETRGLQDQRGGSESPVGGSGSGLLESDIRSRTREQPRRAVFADSSTDRKCVGGLQRSLEALAKGAVAVSSASCIRWMNFDRAPGCWRHTRVWIGSCVVRRHGLSHLPTHASSQVVATAESMNQ